MAIEQIIITWAHLVSASIWVGGGIFLGVVLTPLLKRMPFSTEERLELMIKTGRRFNKIALPSLVILIATGIYNSHLVLQSPEILFSSSYGAFLITKIVLVIALIVTFAVHIRVFSNEKLVNLSSATPIPFVRNNFLATKSNISNFFQLFLLIKNFILKKSPI